MRARGKVAKGPKVLAMARRGTKMLAKTSKGFATTDPNHPQHNAAIQRRNTSPQRAGRMRKAQRAGLRTSKGAEGKRKPPAFA